MEDATTLEKLNAYMKKATADLLDWLNIVKIEREKIIQDAIKENEIKKISALKNKIERL